MRDNRFTYLGDTVDEQLRREAAKRLGMSESDVVRWGVRKLASELGIASTYTEVKKEGERHAESV